MSFKVQIVAFISFLSWASYFTSLSLRFLLYEININTYLIERLYGLKEKNTHKINDTE